MGNYTKIPANTFTALQTDAGVLLSTFNPANPAAPQDADIICATTGGVKASCIPTYSDLGEDVDNCPNGLLELRHLDSWECKIEFTALGVSTDVLKLALGAADISGNKVSPRKSADVDDASDIWWVGDMADGGCCAVCLKNALGTGGVSLQTTKNGKGQLAVTLAGNFTVATQNAVPMEFYVIPAGD